MTKSRSVIGALKPEVSTTGREQLIRAAICLFGRDGYGAIPVRKVADVAGVSFALIRFHFGSKEGLREAAEERVISSYLGLVAQASEARTLDELLHQIDETMVDFPEVTRFLRRAIIDDRPIARRFLSELLKLEKLQRRSPLFKGLPEDSFLRDPIINLARRVGYILLAPQLEEMMGVKVFCPSELKRRNMKEARAIELCRLGLEVERKRARPK
jgi:AcrR family transcriptional regulator